VHGSDEGAPGNAFEGMAGGADFAVDLEATAETKRVGVRYCVGIVWGVRGDLLRSMVEGFGPVEMVPIVLCWVKTMRRKR
jgi:hypothetical protein